MKQFLPGWLKSPVRQLTDRIYRQGGYFEQRARRDFIHQAIITLDFNSISGAYVEFGCCGANTFGYTAEALRRTSRTPRVMYAFDSFAGLPPSDLPVDQHGQWIAGTMKMGLDEFHRQCRRKRIVNYHTIEGYYAQTLPRQPDTFLPKGEIAFAYVDCDMYVSTVEVLRFLRPRLQHGMILAFDDWWCYSGKSLSGERQAFEELYRLLNDWHFEPYLSYGWAGVSFVVEDKSLLTR